MTEKQNLTSRQQEIFTFIKLRLEKVNTPPTIREIGERFNINSTNGVRSIIQALIQKGYIRKTPKVSRGLSLVEEFKQSVQKKETSDPSSLEEIPIIGKVAAGLPMMAVENLEGTIKVDRSFLMDQKNVFALRVHGDSMKNAGILNGDLVFARQQPIANKGDIVIALIVDEATVKYYHPNSDTIRLEPANEAFEPIIISSDTPEFRVIGKVIGIQRQIR